MPLSSQQLTDLRHDLTTLGDIKYEHLTNELLDHYATLTEEQMTTGHTFHEASTAAFQAMGNGAGIQQIQDDYETATKKQVKMRHYAIMRSYVSWPTVVITILVGVLITYLFLLLPPREAQTLSILLRYTPIIPMLAAWILYSRTNDSRKKLICDYVKQRSNFFMLTNPTANTFFPLTDSSYPTISFGLTLLLCTGAVLLVVSLTQLTRETFYVKLNFQR